MLANSDVSSVRAGNLTALYLHQCKKCRQYTIVYRVLSKYFAHEEDLRASHDVNVGKMANGRRNTQERRSSKHLWELERSSVFDVDCSGSIFEEFVASSVL